MSEPFLGEIKAVGFSFAPVNYAFANGALMTIAQNNALYSLLGIQFGGDARSTFGLPNLQSRSPVGYTTNTNTLNGRQNRTMGAVDGTDVKLQLSVNNLPPHSHAAASTATASTTVAPDSSRLGATTAINALTAPSAKLPSPAGNLWTTPSTVGATPTGVAAYAAPGSGTAATMATGAATTTITGSVTATATTTVGVNTVIGSTGSGASIVTLSPIQAVNYIIATAGLYPMRP